MSIFFERDGETVWNPGNVTAHVFLGFVRVLEEELATPSGFGEVVSDEVPVDAQKLERFVTALRSRQDTSMSSLAQPVLERCEAMRNSLRSPSTRTRT